MTDFSAKLRFENLSDEVAEAAYTEIGRFMVAVSALDLEVSRLASAIFEMSDNAFSAILLHSIDLSRKREILSAFASTVPNHTDMVELSALMKAIGDVSTDRNTVAHGIFEFIRAELGLISYAAPKQLKTVAALLTGSEPTLLKIKDLPAKTQKVVRLGRRTMRLREKLAAHASLDAPNSP